MVNVFDFQSRITIEMEMTECGNEKTNDLATMEKDKVKALKYYKRSKDNPVLMKSRKNFYTFFG